MHSAEKASRRTGFPDIRHHGIKIWQLDPGQVVSIVHLSTNSLVVCCSVQNSSVPKSCIAFKERIDELHLIKIQHAAGKLYHT